MSFFVRDCCSADPLFVPFLETSRVSGNTNPWFTPIFLIIITMLTNNSSIFLYFVKIFVLWLVKWWWWNNNLNNIHVSPFFFVFLVRLNWQVYCRDNFQLLSFLPSSKQPFYNTFPFPGATKSLPVFTYFTEFFSQYCLPRASKQSFIWELFHLLSKAFCFDIWNYSYYWK